MWDFLKGSLKKNIIGFYHWEIGLFCKISRNRLLAEEKKNEDNSNKKLWIWPNVENFMESARVTVFMPTYLGMKAYDTAFQ